MEMEAWPQLETAILPPGEALHRIGEFANIGALQDLAVQKIKSDDFVASIASYHGRGFLLNCNPRSQFAMIEDNFARLTKLPGVQRDDHNRRGPRRSQD